MSDPRWFKLLVRAIGMLVLALNLPHLTSAIGTVYMYFGPLKQQRGGAAWDEYYAVQAVTAGVSSISQLGLAVYLLTGAPRFVRYCIRQVGVRCPACDYDIQGIKDPCPECGLETSTPPSTIA